MVGHIITLDSIAQKEVIAPAVWLQAFFMLFVCFFYRGLVDNSMSKGARECGSSRV